MNKYWLQNFPNKTYKISPTKPVNIVFTDIPQWLKEADINKYNELVANSKKYDYVEISKEEYDLFETYKYISKDITMPNNIDALDGLDPARVKWCYDELSKVIIINKADRGQLIDDIAVWHNVFSETLIKIMLFLPYSDLGEKSRLKIVSDVIAKYNLDLVIKDFKPDYVIPERDKGVLATGLKEIEKYNAGIYQRLAMAVGLEADALHNEVIDAYERVIQTIHPTQQIDGNTLAGELPVNAGGTQT